MTLAAAGFPTGSITEIFACISSGSSPPRRIESNTDSTPISVMRTLRSPWSAVRLMSSMA